MRKQEILDARCFCDGSGREPTVGDDESKGAVKWPEEGVVKLPEGQEYDVAAWTFYRFLLYPPICCCWLFAYPLLIIVA